jgi:hypothetical protein
MTDRSPYPDSNGETGAGTSRGSTTGTPRWVKVFGIILILRSCTSPAVALVATPRPVTLSP